MSIGEKSARRKPPKNLLRLVGAQPKRRAVPVDLVEEVLVSRQRLHDHRLRQAGRFEALVAVRDEERVARGGLGPMVGLEDRVWLEHVCRESLGEAARRPGRGAVAPHLGDQAEERELEGGSRPRLTPLDDGRQRAGRTRGDL